MGRSKDPFFIKSWGLYFAWFVFIVILDQTSKLWALQVVPPMTEAFFPYGGIEVGTLGFIEFGWVLAFNKGAAWSFLSQYPSFLLGIRLILIALLLFWISCSRGARRWAVWTILGGAFSNVLDMLFRGAVVDMISFTFWGYHYPVFNLADMMICIGAVSFIALEFKYKESN